MTYRVLRQIGFVCLAAWVAWVSVACGSLSSGANAPVPEADCQVVHHALGDACVPNTIQRLVTLDPVTYEYAFAMSLTPIGTVRYDQIIPGVGERPDVADIGTTGEPNLEKILSLKPDLIMGIDYNTAIYDQLIQIAPTVILPFRHSGEWKERFLQLAEMLGQSEQARSTMDDYRQRIKEFQTAMSDRLSQTVVSVVRVYPDMINLYLKDSFCGVVLQDAGLPRPPSQELSAEEATRQFGNPIQYSINRELFNRADGDAMFIWTADNEPEANQASQKKLAELKDDPLWRSLNAVQKDAVYEVPSYWIGSGPLSANAVVDDLFKYLLEAS